MWVRRMRVHLRTDVCVRTARTGAALGHVTGSIGEAFSNTRACERAIEREKGDMARDSRGRNHGAGTTGRGSRKPTSILTRVRERSRVNADPEARGRERGGGGSSQAWQEGALQACALRA